MYPAASPGTRFAATLAAPLLASATASAPFVQAHAQTVAAGQPDALPAVEIRGQSVEKRAADPTPGYRPKRAVSATKTDTPLKETPQSVTVVTRDQIVDQGWQNVQDAMNYAAGVRSEAWGLDSRTDSVLIRGSVPSTYLDGLRQNTAGYYTATTRTDPYTLERLEVLRGPAGMLFGAGTAAGVVNMVSKRPLQDTQREIGLSIGSHEWKQLQFDLTGALNDDRSLSYRLVSVLRRAGTQVDHVPDDRELIAPSIAWRPTAATSLILQGHWQRDRSGSTAQFFPLAGTILPNPNGQLPSERFIGEPGDGYDSRRMSLGWIFEQQFNDRWTLRNNTRFSRNFNDSHYHWADFSSKPDGWGADPINRRIIGRTYSKSVFRTQLAAADTHLQGRLDTGPVSHLLLVGLDASRQRLQETGGRSKSTIDAFAPVYGIGFVPPAQLLSKPLTRQTNAGIYLQDQMRWDRWIFVAGLRHDRANSSADGKPDESSRATTKRLGVMYELPMGVSPYLSYTESFTPQTIRDANGDLFRPLRGEQIELGAKYNPPGLPLSASVSLYDLKEKNRQVADPASPDFGMPVDASRNRGVEFEVKTTIGRSLDLLAFYQYTKVDRKLENGVPPHQAAVWGRYRFAIANVPGFEAGAGVRYFGAFTEEGVNTSGPRVPSATLVDLMMAYRTKDWRFALNVNNLTDRRYFSTCLARGDCWYGARRMVMASVSHQF